MRQSRSDQYHDIGMCIGIGSISPELENRIGFLIDMTIVIALAFAISPEVLDGWTALRVSFRGG